PHRRGQRPRGRRRRGFNPHGPSHRHGGPGDGTGEPATGRGRRRGLHRHELSGISRADAEPGRHADMIIAIDGPAASGKGTLGRRLASHYGLRHLDTGLIYRAVAKALIDAGHALDDRAAAVAAARALDPARFDETVLKRHAVGEAASLVSAIPEVRTALVALQ